jgi:hypothetical protein
MRYPASVSLRTSQDSSCFDRQAGLDLFNSFFNIAGAENPSHNRNHRPSVILSRYRSYWNAMVVVDGRSF